MIFNIHSRDFLQAWRNLNSNPMPAFAPLFGGKRTSSDLRVLTLRFEGCLRLLDDLFRRGVNALYQVLQLGTWQGRDVYAGFLGVRQELWIAHRGSESIAQQDHELRRNALRRQIGALERLLADDQFGDFALFLALDVLPDLRCAELRQLVIRLQADLRQEIDPVLANPLGLLRLCARPVPAANAVKLAPLDCQGDFERSLVAGYDFELRPSDVLHQKSDIVDRVAGGDAAHDGFLGQCLFEGLGLRMIEGGAKIGAVVGSAEIGHFG